MINDPSIHIGIGMVLSLMATETLGVTAGGLIVPGYIALNLDDPIKLMLTFGVSILTYCIIKFLGIFILIYGKRRLVFTLLLGFLLGSMTYYFSDNAYWNEDFVVIGNIIPGLIANWMDRQGIIRTMSIVLIISSVTRLIVLTLIVLNY
tara:strand:- start:2789 stop:3235 length:447 start_codon:yes stop_codon:yes gene_type:complete